MKPGRKKSKFERLFTRQIIRRRSVPREFLEECEIDKNENTQKLNPQARASENSYFISVNGHEVFETQAQ